MISEETTLFAGVSCGVIGVLDLRGWASEGALDMSALLTASVTASARSLGAGVELASRKKAVVATGKRALTLAGADLTGRALISSRITTPKWLDMIAEAGAVSFKSMGKLRLDAEKDLSMGLIAAIPPSSPSIGLLAPMSKPLAAAPAPDSGQPALMMTAAGGVEILAGDEASAPVLKLSADKIELLVGNDAAVTVDPTSVEIAVGQSSIKASAESLAIDADEVDFS